MHYFVGLDIGGTKTKAVLLNSEKKQLRSLIFPTKTKNKKTAMQRFSDAVRIVSVGKKISAIGIAIAGTINAEKQMMINSPNLHALERIPITKTLQKEFRVPVSIENDANAAAFAESEIGAAKKYENVVLLTIGTGIGSGIIIGKKLFTGATHSGAEIGHMVIDSHGYKCNCGNTGCFEAMANAAFIARRAKELKRSRKTMLEKFDPITVQRAAEKRDAVAKQVYKELSENLGIALANICNILNPDIIVLAGGIAKNKMIYPVAEKKMKLLAFRQNTEKVKLLPSKIGYFAGAIGAALLAMEKK